jgi:inosose dehydratase
MIETGDETAKVLSDSTIDLCLDTGHLLVGGGDPVEVAGAHPRRIAHVHLKDVRRDLAGQVREGRLAYAEAVARDMYVPLGRGDVDIEAIVRSLEGHGYQGWYVLEQDTMLQTPPASPGDLQPSQDARRSLEYLLSMQSAGDDTGDTSPE